jgi:hypothetical protein
MTCQKSYVDMTRGKKPMWIHHVEIRCHCVHSGGKIGNLEKVRGYLQEIFLQGYRKTHPLCRGYWPIYPKMNPPKAKFINISAAAEHSRVIWEVGNHITEVNMSLNSD